MYWYDKFIKKKYHLSRPEIMRMEWHLLWICILLRWIINIQNVISFDRTPFTVAVRWQMMFTRRPIIQQGWMLNSQAWLKSAILDQETSIKAINAQKNKGNQSFVAIFLGNFYKRLRIIWFNMVVSPAKHTAHRDFARHLSVCLSGSLTFFVVTHSYVSQVTHAFLRMLPLCFR